MRNKAKVKRKLKVKVRLKEHLCRPSTEMTIMKKDLNSQNQMAVLYIQVSYALSGISLNIYCGK